MIKNIQTSVDFLPIIEGGDIKKSADHSIMKDNKLILSVINQLYMPKGTLDDFPNIGCMEYILEIPFSEDLRSIGGKISANLSAYQSIGIEVEIMKDPEDPKMAILHISCESIPNFRYTMDVQTSGQSVKIVNYSRLEV